MKLSAIILSLFLAVSGFAQNDTSNWFIDLAEAKEFAKSHDNQILMVFAGSDWCRPCIQFKKDILNSAAFAEFAKEKMAVLYLDFPSKKKNRLSDEQTAHNETLASKYNSQGSFPKIVLTNEEGSVLAEPEFKEQTPEEFISELNHDFND